MKTEKKIYHNWKCECPFCQKTELNKAKNSHELIRRLLTLDLMEKVDDKRVLERIFEKPLFEYDNAFLKLKSEREITFLIPLVPVRAPMSFLLLQYLKQLLIFIKDNNKKIEKICIEFVSSSNYRVMQKIQL